MNRYTFDGWKGDFVPDNGPPGNATMAYLGDFREDASGDYREIPYTAGSDYSGDSVTVSNHRVWLETHGGIDVYGGHGTYAAFVRGPFSESMREDIARLENYPVLDEDDMSQVEMAAESDAWQSWACGDYRRALVKRFPALEDALDDLDNDSLFRLFWPATNSAAEYWINEMGNGAWIDVDRVAAATTESVLVATLAAAGAAREEIDA